MIRRMVTSTSNAAASLGLVTLVHRAKRTEGRNSAAPSLLGELVLIMRKSNALPSRHRQGRVMTDDGLSLPVREHVRAKVKKNF